MRIQGWLGQRYFAPLAGIVVLAGVAMVIESGWEFADTWIVIGIALFVLSTVIGAGFLTPRSEQLATALEQKGMDDPEVQSLNKQLAMLSRADLVILVGAQRLRERRYRARILEKMGLASNAELMQYAMRKELFGPAEGLHATYRIRREEVLEESTTEIAFLANSGSALVRASFLYSRAGIGFSGTRPSPPKML